MTKLKRQKCFAYGGITRASKTGMEYAPFSLSKWEQSRAMAEERYPHWLPILDSMRCGVDVVIVPQRGGRIVLPKRQRPVIMLIGDDLHSAEGPEAFHKSSIRKFVKNAACCAVISCEALVEVYTAIATEAVLLRYSGVIVETRPEQEIQWVNFIREANNDIRMLLASVRGGSA
jgi:hypothetical protein